MQVDTAIGSWRIAVSTNSVMKQNQVHFTTESNYTAELDESSLRKKSAKVDTIPLARTLLLN